jgi:hypothetical protein
MLAVAKQTVKNTLNLVGIKAAKSVIYNAIKLHFSSHKITYIASGGYLHLSKPNVSSGLMHRSFLENFVYPTPALFVTEFTKGKILKRYNLFATFDRHNTLYQELSFDPLERKVHPLWSEANSINSIRLKGKVLSLYTPSAGKSYFMWMVDFMPKFGMLKKAGWEVNDFDRIVMNPLSYQSQHDMLECLGVDKSKIIYIEDNQCFTADQLVVPSAVGRNPFYLKYLRNLFLKEAPCYPTELVYITRRKAKWRNTINEDEVWSVLKPHGFCAYVLEEMTFLEQIEIFSRAKIIVSPHGAGLANLIFCSPQSVLIEFIARHHNNVNFWILASYAQMNYYCIECDSQLGDGLPQHLGVEYHDIRVDIKKLKECIEMVLNLPDGR